MFTLNAFPQEVHSLLSVWIAGLDTGGNAIPPLFTLPETGVEEATGLV